MITRRGFTLIELMITVGILAVVSTLTVWIVNPTQLLRESRDAQRASDLNQIAKAIELANFANLDLGLPNKIYISTPQDGGGSCPVVAPTAQAGYTYSCAPGETYRDTDGTGWIPVDFSRSLGQANDGGSLAAAVADAASVPFTSLPIDPMNSAAASRYYAYITSGRKYMLATRFESVKYQERMRSDEGSDPDVYEIGPGTALWGQAGGAASLATYWPLDEVGGLAAVDATGNSWTGSLVNGPVWTAGKFGGALSFDGVNDFVIKDGYNLNYPITLTVWAKPTTQAYRPLFYVGPKLINRGAWIATDADGSAYIYVGAAKGSGVPYVLNEWQLFTAVLRSATDRQLYVNGTAGAVDTANRNAYAFNSVILGGNWNGGEPTCFKGLIDEARLYTRGLTALEIQSLYSTGN